VAIQITDLDPYRNTSKMCLGGGMHCPSASSLGMQLTIMQHETPNECCNVMPPLQSAAWDECLPLLPRFATVSHPSIRKWHVAQTFTKFTETILSTTLDGISERRLGHVMLTHSLIFKPP